MAKKIVEGLWDCQFCDTKGIRGSIRECPGCGKPRGDNVKFYLPSDYRTRAGVNLTEEEKLPDWQCEYCGSYNKGTDLKCTRCEAPKEGQNYFELHKEVKESTYSANHVNTNWKCHYCGAENPRETTVCKNCGAEKGSEKKKTAPAKKDTRPWPLRHPVLTALGVIFILIVILAILGNKKHDFVAESFRWETTVEVEEYKTVRESDWSVPPGGRVVYTREEIHHYTRNTDDHETITGDASFTAENHSELEKTNPTAYEKSHNPFICKVYADDLGNGYFEVDDGGGSYDSGGDSKTSEPVYATKYYYDIERWVVTRKETASGQDQSPYEPEVTLGDNERKGDVKVIYSVYASKDGKDPKYYYLSEEDFFSLSPGDSFQASGLGSQITVRR